MPQYTFKINNLENRTVDAFDFDDALEQAGIAKDDPYELVEGGDFGEKYFMVAQKGHLRNTSLEQTVGTCHFFG
ncbi:MAG: hypothetical protein WCQ90_07375 [Deltaproteobacteria bacterium]